MVTTIAGLRVVVSEHIPPVPVLRCGPIPYAEDVVQYFNQWLVARFGYKNCYMIFGNTVIMPPAVYEQIKEVSHEFRG